MRFQTFGFEACWKILMTMMMLIAFLAGIGVMACVGVVLLDAVRQRQLRAWRDEYRARGGLGGALYRRWRGTPRLTYRDDD